MPRAARLRAVDRSSAHVLSGSLRRSPSTASRRYQQADDVRERRDGVCPPAIAVGCDERSEEVHLVLVADPAFIDVLERVDEARLGELGKPHRVEEREVGRLALGHSVGQELVERGPRNRDDADADRGRGGSRADHGLPWPFRDDDAHFGPVARTPQPVWVDERPVAALANEHAFLGELGERAADRRPADPEAATQLVLGR